MRYLKGSIALGQEHDYPILRQVIRSHFVTHAQLFEIMKHGGYERDRRVFDWRLRRLVTHGVVLKLQTPALRAEPIYSISPTGSLPPSKFRGVFRTAAVSTRSPGPGTQSAARGRAQ